MKTFLRRPGNKTKHLKHIIPLISEFTGTYYEPFLVLDDLNKDIINIWKLVKTNPDYIIKMKCLIHIQHRFHLPDTSRLHKVNWHNLMI